jgi:hypothetical protein
MEYSANNKDQSNKIRPNIIKIIKISNNNRNKIKTGYVISK